MRAYKYWRLLLLREETFETKIEYVSGAALEINLWRTTLSAILESSLKASFCEEHYPR
jgi:hypothetical protein